jgi:hypothetical protein
MENMETQRYVSRIQEVFPYGFDLRCGESINCLIETLKRLRLKFGKDGYMTTKMATVVDHGEKWAYLTPALLETIPDGFIRIYFRTEEEAVMAKMEL